MSKHDCILNNYLKKTSNDPQVSMFINNQVKNYLNKNKDTENDELELVLNYET